MSSKEFEFVEFYPNCSPNKEKQKRLGTCHIYLIEEKMDVRGITVVKKHKGDLLMLTPAGFGYDEKTGKPVRYPVLSFTDGGKAKRMLDFLYQEVAPIVRERLGMKAWGKKENEKVV